MDLRMGGWGEELTTLVGVTLPPKVTSMISNAPVFNRSNVLVNAYNM